MRRLNASPTPPSSRRGSHPDHPWEGLGVPKPRLEWAYFLHSHSDRIGLPASHSSPAHCAVELLCLRFSAALGARPPSAPNPHPPDLVQVVSSPTTLQPRMQRVPSMDAHPGAWFLLGLCRSWEAFEKAGLELKPKGPRDHKKDTEGLWETRSWRQRNPVLPEESFT